MPPFAVCIPTLCCYDLLEQALACILASTLPPERILVIDNGGGFPERAGVEVYRPGRNLGVASSWNLGARLLAPLQVVWLNDDFFVAADTFARMAEVYARDPNTPAIALGFCCFTIHPATYAAVGPFDEAFWPAYNEDNDYVYRLLLAGRPPVCIAPGGERYHISSTVARYRPPEFSAGIAANGVYYVNKWGGPPGHERFTAPFGVDS